MHIRPGRCGLEESYDLLASGPLSAVWPNLQSDGVVVVVVSEHGEEVKLQLQLLVERQELDCSARWKGSWDCKRCYVMLKLDEADTR
jgi:hypothetical protein